MKNFDILTIDDVALEIRVGIITMRRRKEREELARRTNEELTRANQQLSAQLHAAAGWPRRLALSATT
jgi:hypothetical protein